MAIDRAEQFITPILEAEGFELVDLEYKKEGKKFFLRIYIDNENGITLDDCQNLSNQISAVLDVEDVITQNYTLEVSSPGVERPLKKIDDYNRFKGKKIKIHLYKPLDGIKTIVGSINCVEGNMIVINEDETDYVRKVFHQDVAKANLVFEW